MISTANLAPTHESGGASKDRPDELSIKPFKPLPIPTPSREATLTQKLEQVRINSVQDYKLVFIHATSPE